MDHSGMSGMSGMGSSSSTKATCKISMLWNWDTINTCFLARSWHNTSKGMFAGSCLGVFFFVVAFIWFHRFSKEYDIHLVRYHLAQRKQTNPKLISESDKGSDSYTMETPLKLENPFWTTLKHGWLFSVSNNDPNEVVPTLPEHLIRTALFTIEYGASYLIMLLFMYFNGYIIIMCILGALFGRLLFGYERLGGCEEEDTSKKCCRS